MASFSLEDTGDCLLIKVEILPPEEAGDAVRFGEYIPDIMWGNYTADGQLVGMTVRAPMSSGIDFDDDGIAARLTRELGENEAQQLRREYEQFTRTLGHLILLLPAA